MEDAVVVLAACQYLVQMLPVGIRDEDLSEIITAHELYNLLHTTGIELVEDVVEQQ